MKTAIYGGTFDPVHRAHIRVALEAADRFGLDRVLLITSGNPPHKPAGATTSYEHRHRMVELACLADARLRPSKLEEGQGISYSYGTIQCVRATLEPEDELFFLIGADAFAEIGSWYRQDDVLRMVQFIVVSRPGYTYPVPAGATVHRLETLSLPVSSSEIRARLQAGEAVDELDPAVMEYIRSNGLYTK